MVVGLIRKLVAFSTPATVSLFGGFVGVVSCVAAGAPFAPTSPGPHVAPPDFCAQLGAHAQTPSRQAFFVQSDAALQLFAGAHFGAVGPPQSTSVSSPFFAPSVALGAAQ